MKYTCVTIALLSITWTIFSIVSVDGAFTRDPVVDASFHEACNQVDRAIEQSMKTIKHNKNPKSPSDLLRLFRFPTRDMIRAALPEEILERTIAIVKDHDASVKSMRKRRHTEDENDDDTRLTQDMVGEIAAMSGCNDFPVTCHDMCFHSKYRTIDGTCNNFDRPTQAASLTPFARIIAPVYENGFNEPVGWNTNKMYDGFHKPSPRKVSYTIGSTTTITNNHEITDLVTLFGQFLDHDMDLTPMSPSSVSFNDDTPCNETCRNNPPCFPIDIPDDDPRIRDLRCMEFVRSSAACGTGIQGGMPVREQINAITSYIDASQVYGSSLTLADTLREFDGKGSLRVGSSETHTGRPFLPFDPDSPMACLSDESMDDIPCFLAGDSRANELTGLTSMHTLFLREHNRISNMLSQINPHWDDERLYQEARQILGATLQHITYDHYLPKIIGDVGMESMGVYNGYDPDTNAAIANVFATAAFRFGHATVKPFISRLDEHFNETSEGHLPLHRAFFQPWRIVEEGGIDPVIRGFFATAAKDLNPGEIMTDELTERLFTLTNSISMDLMSLNIQRGRDHGLPSYTEWRKDCGLPKGRTFNQLKREISNDEVREKLEDLYGHPNNIDLYIGALAEDPLEDSLLGPTFTCILAKQFKNTRNGDRFWYERPGYLTPNQLASIKRTSLARVICDNTDIKHVQRDVFSMPSISGGFLKCDDIRGADLADWTDRSGNLDHTPPHIKCPMNITHYISSKQAKVTWVDPITTDDSNDPVKVTCTKGSGQIYSLGVTTVMCTATDSSGNCATCRFSINLECVCSRN
ncbi:peroxidasin homolog [Saccoglossus kowalevskii]